ncbi:MAG: AAA family ATPase [Oscillospiraceae bacterium]|nr:AAA family ATPase [Oscillospiraceae bacterium]
MKDDMDTLLNSVFGSRPSVSPKKEDLQDTDSALLSMQAALDAMNKNTLAAANADKAVFSQLTDNQQSLNAQIANMQRELEKDGLVPQKETLPAQSNPLEAFNGLAETLNGCIKGQKAFVSALVMAFKRPFVAGYDAPRAKNCILLLGQKGTGRHTALLEICRELHTKGALSNGIVRLIDLSAYPTAGESKLFLQDMYAALQSGASVLLFENYNTCHPGILTSVSELVTTGKIKLETRYVAQKGILVEAGSALSPNVVSELCLKEQYLVFISEDKKSKVADTMGSKFIASLGDVCETGSFTAESLQEIAAIYVDTLVKKAESKLLFDLHGTDILPAHFAAQYTKELGITAVEEYAALCFKALSEYRLRMDTTDKLAVTFSLENGILHAAFGSDTMPLFNLLGNTADGSLEEVKAEFEKIVGHEEIKAYILSLENAFKVQALRKAQGLKTSSPAMHMIFTGNPGTGKTTVARLIAKYLKAIGVLSGGQLVEVTRADLVGRYVGHTAPLTRQVIESALGGVLFIDEAYALYRGKDDNFGLEAIDTLVKGMEDNRDDIVVILAGYTKEMFTFLEANSGLKSRFPNILEFKDYTGAELLQIAHFTAEGKGYRLDEGCDIPLLAYFNAIQALAANESGNGRFVRNKVEQAILNQSRRIIAQPTAALDLLISGDFELELPFIKE